MTQVRKGDDGRRSSTSTLFSSDEPRAAGGRPGPDRQALRAFEKLGGFAAMCRQLELHTTCQAVCDALMGMIFGVWGSKHEPRPIREKDVLAIKGNKESWLRCDPFLTETTPLWCELEGTVFFFNAVGVGKAYCITCLIRRLP